jgi:hypothetical protein
LQISYQATAGFCYIVYGENAEDAATQSVATLRKHNSKQVHIIGDRPLPGCTFSKFEGWGTVGRLAKINLDRLTPFENTCYLDADTIIHSRLAVGFSILNDGWDMVICPSANQGEHWLRHVGEEESLATLIQLRERFLQLQAGVIWFNAARCKKFFQLWRLEWNRWQDQDQAALLRALYEAPIKIWLLGNPWSNGEMVRHLHGKLGLRKR